MSASVHAGIPDTPPGADTPLAADTPREQTPPPPEQTLPHPGADTRHTVNERPVRILLECILVLYVMILTKQLIHLIRALHRNRSLQQRKKS